MVAGGVGLPVQTIDDHRLQFGELAGPLAHGATFFDWQLISTQEIAAAFEYPFEEILAADGIPYAPVLVEASVERYPTIGDVITVDTVPTRVGDSSLELLYEIGTEDGTDLATIRATHVTIDPDGSARSLPAETRTAFADVCVDRDPEVGPREEGGEHDDLASFSTSVRIHSPYIEGAELAYFEEYPRFADIALEEHLLERGTSLGALAGEKQPYRLRDWRWEFTAPVRFETTLEVACEVLAADRETIRIAHTLSSDGRTNIEALSEYGCFDRDGEPVPFDEEMIAPFEV